jgi:hypothetical protein
MCHHSREDQQEENKETHRGEEELPQLKGGQHRNGGERKLQLDLH